MFSLDQPFGKERGDHEIGGRAGIEASFFQFHVEFG
jgi:hypothetical protein